MTKLIRVLGENIAVRIDPKDDTTQGGIILASMTDRPRVIGTVELKGVGNHEINVGDRVLITYKDANVTPDPEVFIFPPKSVLAVIG